MAHQHYVGKKHKRNELRKKLVAEIGTQAIPLESKTNGKQHQNEYSPLYQVSMAQNQGIPSTFSFHMLALVGHLPFRAQ